MEENSQFKWGVVLVACIAIFIIVLDSSAMNVSISAVIVDLNTDLSTIQALIAIYALTIASLMLTGSKLQDVLGRKKTFFAGVIIYGVRRQRPTDGIWHLGRHRRYGSCYRPPLRRSTHVLRQLAIHLCGRTARRHCRNRDEIVPA